MSLASKATLAVLVVDAVLLALVTLLFLPLRIGPVPVPITVVLAAVSTPWLVRSAAALGGRGGLAGVPLVVWVATILVVGIGGPGGDVLLPNDWRSLLVLAAGIFPGAVALGRVLAGDLQNLPHSGRTPHPTATRTSTPTPTSTRTG